MSEHFATIRWVGAAGGAADFLAGKFNRAHTWSFDGGVVVPGSAAPSVVPAPYSNSAHVDPEEALVAAVSSCHMLTYLYYAHRKGFVVERYEDEAVGAMTKNDKGVPWVGTVTLRPQIEYGGDKRPTADEEEQLHHTAHEKCFIANSVKCDIKVEPVR